MVTVQVDSITRRIRESSTPTRGDYLQRIERQVRRDRSNDRMGCANLAHAFAALPTHDKMRVVRRRIDSSEMPPVLTCCLT